MEDDQSNQGLRLKLREAELIRILETINVITEEQEKGESDYTGSYFLLDMI